MPEGNHARTHCGANRKGRPLGLSLFGGELTFIAEFFYCICYKILDCEEAFRERTA